MTDKLTQIALAINEVLAVWAEERYLRKDPLGGMAVSRFKRYKSEIAKDIERDPELRAKLEEKLNGLV